MSRIVLIVLLLNIVSCASKNSYHDMKLFIPVGNRCDGCVQNILNLLDACGPKEVKIIFTSIYTRSDLNFVSDFCSQNQYNAIVDSTNIYSSLETVSVYPVLYENGKEILVFDPNDLEVKLHRLENILKCDES